jgi:glycosyltransferase involved in cell wall biosynthesis
MTRRPPSVSVILCTRNRSRRLGPCLDRVAASGRRARSDWELVLVDNGSTDDTRDVLREWAAASSVDVQIVHEPRGGLSAARNRGIDASRGAVLAFVDDDCLVEDGWLEAIVAVHAVDPPPDLVGGRVDLWDEADARVSIRPFDDALEIRDFRGICARLIGCNFSVRADALRSIGHFDERLGAGTASGSAEDFDVFYRLLKAGYRLRFEPGVRVYHAHGRREPREIEALGRRYVRGRGAMYAKHAMQGDATMLVHFLGELLGRTRHRVRSELAGGAFEFLRLRGGAGLSTGGAG